MQRRRQQSNTPVPQQNKVGMWSNLRVNRVGYCECLEGLDCQVDDIVSAVVYLPGHLRPIVCTDSGEKTRLEATTREGNMSRTCPLFQAVSEDEAEFMSAKTSEAGKPS
jgi:hypothetical protein